MSLKQFLLKKNVIYAPIGDFVIIAVSIAVLAILHESTWSLLTLFGIIFSSMNLGIDIQKYKTLETKGNVK